MYLSNDNTDSNLYNLINLKYEEKIHHLADQMISINLDDGVIYNYTKLADVLAKIK